MSKLITEILADYGTVPQRIGKFLEKRNGSHMDGIMTNTSLARAQIVQGLSLMIQRRFIRYFQYERHTYYSLDVDMIHRRMFYSMYLRLVESEFGYDACARFMNILIHGFVRRSDEEIPTELLDVGVITLLTVKAANSLATLSKEPSGIKVGKKTGVEDVDSDRKSRRIAENTGFYIVDFDALDSIMIDNRILAFVRRRYSSVAENVYKTILNHNLATPEVILEHLHMIHENGPCCMNKDDVTSCLKYLCNCGVLKNSLDGSGAYFKDRDGIRRVLTTDCLDRVLSSSCKEARRLFNMMVEYKTLEDKDIAPKSLLPSHVVKKALFLLHSNGFVVLRYSSGSEHRPNLLWQINIDHTLRFVAEDIKRRLGEDLKVLNKVWLHLGWSEETLNKEEGKMLAKCMGLASELLILRS